MVDHAWRRLCSWSSRSAIGFRVLLFRVIVVDLCFVGNSVYLVCTCVTNWAVDCNWAGGWSNRNGSRSIQLVHCFEQHSGGSIGPWLDHWSACGSGCLDSFFCQGKISRAAKGVLGFLYHPFNLDGKATSSDQKASDQEFPLAVRVSWATCHRCKMRDLGHYLP